MYMTCGSMYSIDLCTEYCWNVQSAIYCYIYNFSGFSVGSCINEEEGYLLPTYIIYMRLGSHGCGFADLQPYNSLKMDKIM